MSVVAKYRLIGEEALFRILETNRVKFNTTLTFQHRQKSIHKSDKMLSSRSIALKCVGPTVIAK